MDQQNLSTLASTVNATEEFLRDSLAKATLRVAELEEHIQKVTQRSYSESADKTRVIEAMHEWTLQELGDNGITESQAEEIADICGFDLTKEFEVEVTVTYSMTVNARTAEDAEYAVHDIDFDTVSYNDDSISYLSSSVDSVDIQQGATNKPEHVYKLLTHFPQIFGRPRQVDTPTDQCDSKHIYKMSDLSYV